MDGGFGEEVVDNDKVFVVVENPRRRVGSWGGDVSA